MEFLEGLPPRLADQDKGTLGRYVRVELPGRGTLTPTEVEVLSGGLNVARKGRASQKNKASGGDASRAIDGNKSGRYGDGDQTHTEENTNRPYWEIDLGEELPIERVAIYNRTDGDLGKRLDGFTLSILDGRRGEVFKQDKLRAPAESMTLAVSGGSPVTGIRQAAMTSLTYVRGKEAETFKSLAKFVNSNVDRLAAIRSLQRIPRSYWDKEAARPLLETIVSQVKQTAVADRTTPPCSTRWSSLMRWSACCLWLKPARGGPNCRNSAYA